jgi:hypothetical protein
LRRVDFGDVHLDCRDIVNLERVSMKSQDSAFINARTLSLGLSGMLKLAACQLVLLRWSRNTDYLPRLWSSPSRPSYLATSLAKQRSKADEMHKPDVLVLLLLVYQLRRE